MAKKGSKFNKYTYEFKVMVVEDYLSGKSGGIDTITKKYNLKSNYQVRNWLKKYKKGITLLSQETRGRVSSGRPRTIKLVDMSVEEQNRYLKMENDILKKLKALLKKYGEL